MIIPFPLVLLLPLASAAVLSRDERPRTLIPSAFWSTLVRYTNIQSASVFQPCYIPPYGLQIVKYIDNNLSDTQATVFRDDSTKEILVTFPGTASNEDIFFDVNIELLPFVAKGIDLTGSCLGCAVHGGFLLVWNSIADELAGVLRSALQVHLDYTITLTGHSLGGGIASLAYPALKGVGLPVTKLFTFGGPRAGNVFFANHVDSISHDQDVYRVTHAYDIIPRILLRAIGYQHHSVEIYEQNVTTDPRHDASPDATFRCYGQEPADCIDSLGLQFTTGDAHGYYTNINLGRNPLVCSQPLT